MEIWKDIAGFEGLYQVSNLGNVRSLDRVDGRGRNIKGFLRRQVLNKNGYLYVNLSKHGKPNNYSVHRLVATAFVNNPAHKETVNHINENKTDNRAENLEWVTLIENLRYGSHDRRVAETRKEKYKGPAHPNFGRRGKNALAHKGKVIGINEDNPADVVEFDTAADAARALHISSGRLCEAINHLRKSCGGYRWRRADD